MMPKDRQKLSVSFFCILLAAISTGCTNTAPDTGDDIESLCVGGLIDSFVAVFGRAITMESLGLNEDQMDNPVWLGESIISEENNCRLIIETDSAVTEYSVEKDEFGEYALAEMCITDSDGREACYDYEAIQELAPFYGKTSDTFIGYSSIQYGISIDYPSNWEVTEDLTGVIVSFSSLYENLQDEITENLNIVFEDLSLSPVSLDSYMEISLQQLESVVDGYNLISSSQTLLSNNSAYEVVYTGSYGGRTLKWMQVFAIEDDAAYIITYTAELESYPDFLDAVQRMLDSFRII